MAVVKVKTPSGKVKEIAINDIRPYTWYDTCTIKKNEKTQTYTLFQSTSGSKIIRNVQVPSSIPAGQEFELQQIRIAPIGQAAAADLDKVLKNTVLIYKKGGSDEIFTKPLYEFATGSGVWTPNSQVDAPVFGFPSATAVNPLPFSIFIKGGDVMQFIIETDFQFAPDQNGDYLSADVSIQVALVGILKKPAI